MSPASKGRSKEWLVRDFLRRRGYNVFRARGSLGPCDLIAMNQWEDLVVAVRKTRWPSPSDRRDLADLEVRPDIRAVCARVNRRGLIEFIVHKGEYVFVSWFGPDSHSLPVVVSDRKPRTVHTPALREPPGS